MPRTREALAMDTLESPIGGLLAVFDGAERLWALDFEDHAERMRRLLRTQRGLADAPAPGHAPRALRKAFDAYFAGQLDALDTLEVHLAGTEFQQRVWTALREIPAGTTATYGQQAQRLGHPQASRAVGRANGSNPIGIVLPCHRVIGASGALTGYGGGLERKRWLLAHERAESFTPLAARPSDRPGLRAARAGLRPAAPPR